MKRAFVAAGVAALVLATWTSTASAHATLETTDPPNGAVLAHAPTDIRLRFTERPDPSLTVVEITDGNGATVPVEGSSAAPGDPRTVIVTPGALPDGAYTVSWRVVSSVDGHLTAGAFSFGVGVRAQDLARGGAAEQVSTPTALAVAGRWGLYAGLAVLLGAAITGLLAFRPATVRRPWALAGAWTLAAVGLVAMTLDERGVIGVPLGTLLESEAGGTYLRLALSTAVAGGAALAVALRPTTPTLVLLAGAAGIAMGFRATGGHAGASTMQAVVQGLHFAAVGAWIGGLVWLVPAVRRSPDGRQVRRYSNVAAVGLGALLVTGIVRATNELGGPGRWLELFDTDYGTALAAKLAVVVPLVGLGALNRFRNLRRFGSLGARPMLRTVGGELALAAGVLALTGVLTGLPPEEDRAPAEERPPPLVATGSDFATTTRARLQVAPGTVGSNAFVAEVTDYDTGEPVDARRVALSFRLPDRPDVTSTLELERRGDTWQARGAALSITGTWEVGVLVEAAPTSVEVPLLVTVTPPGQRLEVAGAEGQPDLATAHLPDGRTIQAYVDPGEPGRTNQVHVTAFEADGSERPLESVVLRVTPPGGATERIVPERLTPGHVVANVELERGSTRFAIDAVAADGERLAAAFAQRFEG